MTEPLVTDSLSKPPIRVFLVEDSPVALVILKRLLATSPDIEVVGTAVNGLEALERLPHAQPDVICTDLHMDRMDGLEFTRCVMATFPRPILVVSASVQPQDTHNIFHVLAAGAVDVFPKPGTGATVNYESEKLALINKIKVLAGVKVFTHYPRRESSIPPPPGRQIASSQRVSSQRASRVKAIAIGASTGGPQTLNRVLKPLPASFPVPIVCVQHISEGFLQGLVSWLDSECQLSIQIAQAGEAPTAGHVYFAPERHHLELDAQGRFLLSQQPAVSGHRPSVTVMFQSVARFYRQTAIGILLTGMGRDGAEGMQAIATAGGMTIAQDEASCVVFGMPKEAIALGAAQQVLSASEIAPALLNQLLK